MSENTSYLERLEKLFFQNCERPWEQKAPSIRLSPHVYYVGGVWIGVTLIDTGDGLILVDSGMPRQLYLIFEGIRELGYNPKSIKKLLITHGHYDHVGAAKAVQDYTGAEIYASREDLPAIEGKDLKALRNRGEPYIGVTPNGFFNDDKKIRQGNIEITTMLTPGHTPGTTSLHFMDGDYMVAIPGGLGINTLIAKTTDEIAETQKKRDVYRNSLQRLGTWDVDVTSSNHPAMIELFERVQKSAGNLCVHSDKRVWKSLIDRYTQKLDALDAAEKQRWNAVP